MIVDFGCLLGDDTFRRIDNDDAPVVRDNINNEDVVDRKELTNMVISV